LNRVTHPELVKRASNIAKSGDAMTRAGAFDFEAMDLQRKAKTLVAEAQSAYRSLTQWEAITNAIWRSDAVRARRDMDWSPLHATTLALARDAVLGAFRLSDPIQPDDAKRTVSLCLFANYFAIPENKARLASDAWWQGQGVEPDIAAMVKEQEHERMAAFCARVPLDWRNGGVVSDASFADLRRKLRDLRNYLAHPNAYGPELDVAFDDAATFVRLTLELATDAAVLVLREDGPAAAIGVMQVERNRARKFWQRVAADLLAEPMTHGLHDDGLQFNLPEVKP
jgi:hypothetical protein